MAAALLAQVGAAQAGGNPQKFKLSVEKSPNVAVDYDALNSLPPDTGPVIIGEGVELTPPPGVARYRHTKVQRASLARFDCPCAHRLHLKPRTAHRKAAHKVAKVEPAATGPGSMPSQGIPTRVAAEPIAPPPPPPAAKPAPAPTPPAHTAPPPPAPKVAAAPPSPPAPPPSAPAAVPPPPPPAKVASAPPPNGPPANSATSTTWSTPGASTAPAKAPPPPVAPPPAPAPAPAPAAKAPPNVSLPQVLTPPPPAKAPEKAPEKTAEKVAAAPPPAPPPAPAPAKPVDITKPPTEVAAVPPAPVKPAETKAAAAAPVAVSYATGGSAVPEAALPTLKEISDKMAADSNLRVQLFSYASDKEKNVSRSRRLSLERAVAVRKILIDNGLDSTRIEVRALGDQNPGGEPDRVDVVLSARR